MRMIKRNVSKIWRFLKQTLVCGVRFNRLTLRSLYLPDETSLYSDVFTRLLFSMYYIPALVMAIAITQNALQRVVWNLVFPVTQEMERNSHTFSSTWILMLGLCDIFCKVAPFATLGISIATVGHKLTNCITEAMLDAYTKHHGRDYPLLHAHLRFMVMKRFRVVILLIVIAGLSYCLVCVFYKSIIEYLLHKEPVVLGSSLVIGLMQILFAAMTALHGPWSRLRLALEIKRKRCIFHEGCISDMHLPSLQKPRGEVYKSGKDESLWQARKGPGSNVRGDDPSKKRSHLAREDGHDEHTNSSEKAAVAQNYSFFAELEHKWWIQYASHMRYIALGMVAFFSVAVAILYGPLRGLTTAVLVMMCLDFPHLLAYMSLSFTSATIRTLRSYRWLSSHRDARLPLFMVLLPYELMMGSALVYFRHHILTSLMLVGVNGLLVARGIDLVREFEMTENGCVNWVDTSVRDQENLLRPSLAILLEDTYESEDKQMGFVSVDMFFDMERMLIKYSGGVEIPISRRQIIPYGAARRLLRSQEFYFYVLPRLLSLQSPGYFAGVTFRTARVILRIVSITILLLFAFIVTGMLLQAAFPELRPIAVRAYSDGNNSLLTFDHVVVHMHLLSSNNLTSENSDNRYCMRTKAARSSLKWIESTSDSNEDLYPHLCTRDYYGTSVLELALLALAPYLSNTDEVNTMLTFMNKNMGSDWRIEPRYGTACLSTDSAHQPTGWTGFYDFYSASRNTSVIAIRGTDLFSFTDFLIDINLFFETALYQFMTMIVPGALVIPKELVVNLIRITSLQQNFWSLFHRQAHAKVKDEETWAQLLRSSNKSLRECRPNNYRRNFYADVYNHLVFRALQEEHPKNVVLTGHSLGGAVATILAAQLDIKAVAFAAPGILLARRKFDANLRWIHKNVLTIISSSDIVPKLGQHGGEVHHIECIASRKELCHAMELLIGTLWRACASLRAKYPMIQKVV